MSDFKPTIRVERFSAWTSPGPYANGLEPRATFQPHSQQSGTWVGMLDGKAYAIWPTDDGGLLLLENPAATMLIQDAEAGK